MFFVSYAHGDDRDWINRFVGRLQLVLKRRLSHEASIWIDDEDLRKSRDFRKEIPDTLKSSAVLLLLPRPPTFALHTVSNRSAWPSSKPSPKNKCASRTAHSPTIFLRSVVPSCLSMTMTFGS